MLRDEVLDKLAKLKAHEESARKIGSLAEAEVFAGKIQELLLRYRIEMAEVELQQRDADDPIEGERVILDPALRRRRQVWWQVELAKHVALAHGCDVLVGIPLAGLPANSFFIVGRRVERQTAAYLFTYLVRTLTELCDSGYREARKAHAERGTLEEMDGWRRGGWRQGFYEGAVHSLRDRLRAAEDRVARTTGEMPWGLVKAEMARVDAVVQQLSAGKQRIPLFRSGSESGFQSGQQAGQTVRLGHDERRLGEPRRQLKPSTE